ncbi:MAG: pyrroline-5-carboxylate reductase [Promethearchaeota archaeon]
MPQKIRLGILGVGNMGSAIASGILGTGVVPDSEIRMYDVDSEKLENFTKNTNAMACVSEVELVENSDLVILAIKPQVASSVLEKISGGFTGEHVILSIMAGIPISFIRARVPAVGSIIRVMPNTPLLVGEGMTCLSFEEKVPPQARKLAMEIFSQLGKALELEEKYLDAVTALSGSGPAYVLAFLEALADGGLKVGLSKTTALELAAQTVLGTIKLYLERGLHPAQLRDVVTSPGGTTIAGLHELERGKFKASVMDAVESATKRSKELGKILK